MNKKTLIATFAILTTFTAASILAIIAAKKITVTDNKAITNIPDFFMNNAIYTKFNSDGKISNQVKTSKMTHMATNNIYLFENPQITIYNPKEKPWHISAKKGRSEQGKSKVYLWDNVKLIQKAGPHNYDFAITTNSLSVYPDRKFAETEDPIKVTQLNNIVNAIGAELDLENSSIKLLSKIEGLYVIK